ncbi:hypothetical protein [Poseidonibacter ostreae]|jgi:hypothetical protein|uniref:Uncharacterized protein n=1 Tax=Poseidonibacter ostreae TaxID=2654171 RepID=A0A6L4WVU8_9BACT|nr:hypothetical protein [Poseidonibacter ostreae]KAB7888008.1 hypothetical protein GA417_01205 [Poseidonibacter ostreae]KAB7891073.1 hypothetical protein GBG19_01530 [Poseidonibacter ostreae]KAB7892797.1 hypothetical protein GBG18_01240 [Poseidonibacter ostreae]
MELFIKLEAGYLGIGLFTLLITLFVTTRPFMSKGSVVKGLIFVAPAIAMFIGMHFYVTSSRMVEVETAFEKGDKVICESRAIRKVAQSVTIEKSNEWTLKDHNFSSPNYNREFFSARCIKFVPLSNPPKK